MHTLPHHSTEEKKKLLWFSSTAAVQTLMETGRRISASEVITQIDDLPGDAFASDIASIREHFEDTAWVQVLAKGTVIVSHNDVF